MTLNNFVMAAKCTGEGSVASRVDKLSEDIKRKGSTLTYYIAGIIVRKLASGIFPLLVF